MPIRYSVIIPTLNEEKHITGCLNALANLAIAREAYEVIVVDNGSTDQTLAQAETFSKRMNLITAQKRGATISALRNLGASKAQGAILGFLDADCLVSPQWLTRADTLLQLKDVGIVGAHYRIPQPSRWVARAWYGGLETEKQGDMAWVPSGDLLMMRATFARVNGFDATLRTNEDYELCYRLRRTGLRIRADASIAVIHLGTPQTVGRFYKKIVWHGTDGLRVFWRELPRLTNARPLLLAVFTLLCFVGMLVGLASVPANNGRVFLGFVAAWVGVAFLLSLRLAMRRRAWNQLLPLTVLHLVYGTARAQALFGLKSR